MNININSRIKITVIWASIIISGGNMQAQIPDPDQGLRADWLRGTWGIQWNAKGIENGGSETLFEDFVPFLNQVKGFQSLDYIDVYLNTGGYYSCVHTAPNLILESLWEGDMSGGKPINLIVPRASAGVDPLMEMLKAIKAEGLRTQVYANCFNFMRANPDNIPNVSERWFAYCDNTPEVQAFINSQSYHKKNGYPNREYYFCYTEFILKEYAIRYGDLINSWLFDAAHSLAGFGDDYSSGKLEDQRIYQAFADAVHAGNPNAAVAFNNGPNRETEEITPFTSATLFDDFMFGHPYNAGKSIGSHTIGDPLLYDRNHAMILKMLETDGHVWNVDNTWTWDDFVVGHLIFPMSTINWSTGDTPALTNEEFLLWNLEVFQGKGAITWGVALKSPYGAGTDRLIQDWAMAQLTLMDTHLLANGDPGRTSPHLPDDNLALSGKATQSSTAYGCLPGRAIDGNTDGAFDNNSVTQTSIETNPWWEVDLGAEYRIGVINVFGRTDACCIDRLSNFTVIVYNAVGTEVFAETFTSYPNPSVTSNTGGVNGQKVRVVLNTTNGLSLAEVQVFGFLDDATGNKISALEIADKDWILYPNPANNTLNFDFRNIQDVDSIEIYSISGKQILMQEINNTKGFIDISRLESGVYVMRIYGKLNVNTTFVKK